MAERFTCLLGDRVLTLETNKISPKANAAVTVQYGGTVVLATVCRGTTPKEVGFAPLTVDFEERLYAAGKIPGGFFRREGRPSEEAILAARLTDRPLRPLLPKNFPYEVQIIVTVLSADQENPPNILSIIGSSAALMLSDIPFLGPVGAVQVGYLNGKWLINPTFSQLEESLLSLVVAGTKEKVVMLEGGANEAPEELILEAVKIGHQAAQETIRLQEELASKLSKPKLATPQPPSEPEAEEAVASFLKGRDILSSSKEELLSQLKEHFKGKFSDSQLSTILENECKKQFRQSILEQKKRPDGRGLEELRPVSAEVGVLPRTHGSALFIRGGTQVLTITTLGSLEKAQYLDGLTPQERKRFLHHYNFPPFSTGEIKRLGIPSRREIGHGALVERALLPLIPSENDFYYTIRLVSEVLSSDGSTSMASVCSSSLSLMDAGVPIKRPAAGIAIGLVTDENGNYALLTDIAGLEDAYGDMDFKIAGTSQGITALQMDIKLPGIGYEVIEKALERASLARLIVLDKMREVLPKSRAQVSPYAPKMYTITIDPSKIGYVIGFGGKTIKSIIEETDTTINIEEDGRIIIGAVGEEKAKKAIQKILELTTKAEAKGEAIQVGKIYTGRVCRLVQAGAIVELLPGKEGLVPLRELAEYYVHRADEVVKIGDEIMVKVIDLDRQGRPILSRKALFESLPRAKRQ